MTEIQWHACLIERSVSENFKWIPIFSQLQKAVVTFMIPLDYFIKVDDESTLCLGQQAGPLKKSAGPFKFTL